MKPGKFVENQQVSHHITLTDRPLKTSVYLKHCIDLISETKQLILSECISFEALIFRDSNVVL